MSRRRGADRPGDATNAAPPPGYSDSEWSVIGACVLGGAFTAAEVGAVLSRADFVDPLIGAAFDTIQSLYAGGAAHVDRVTLRQALVPECAEMGLSANDAAAFVNAAYEVTFTAANALFHARRVKDRALLARTNEEIALLSGTANGWDGPARDLIAEAQRRFLVLDALASPAGGEAATGLPDALPPFMAGLREDYALPPNTRGLDTGLPLLNGLLRGGLKPGNLLILAARPGVGKTALALNMAVAAAKRDDAAVRIFSMEMTRDELLERLVFTDAEVDTQRYSDRTLSEADWGSLDAANARLSRLRIDIEDDSSMTVSRLVSVCRRAHFAGNLDLVIVDYAQLLSTGAGSGTGASPGRRYENRTQEVGEITRALKQLAGTLKVPVIALSQLNRAVESRADKIPTMADLRESGSLEQDANTVMLLYPYDADTRRGENPPAAFDSEENKTYLLDVPKNRGGKMGRVPLIFWPQFTRFVEMSHRVEAGK